MGQGQQPDCLWLRKTGQPKSPALQDYGTLVRRLCETTLWSDSRCLQTGMRLCGEPEGLKWGGETPDVKVRW